ncbi:MAG: CoA pyrophosphatase [Myxococcota bacterium]|jgi:8-oxo-dGTP pyrophosphatase MutT (NUDIX family)|nr:CoA pyrophosphatase [Myxococcota bacterium]
MPDLRILEHLQASLAASSPVVLSRERCPARAAVAVTLVESGPDLHVALMRRADRPDDPWAGQMSFPGGREEPGDQDPWATAIREAEEELGLQLARAHRLGRLDDVQALAAGRALPLAIAPLLFALPQRQPLRPRADEVAEGLWVPLAALRDPARRVVVRRSFDGQPYELPGVDYEGRIVWGLTYRMLQSLFTRWPERP